MRFDGALRASKRDERYGGGRAHGTEEDFFFSFFERWTLGEMGRRRKWRRESEWEEEEEEERTEMESALREREL